MKKTKKSTNTAPASVNTEVRTASQWLKTAERLVRVLDSGSWRARYSSEATWYRHMSETQGYNAATLRRQVRLFRFLESQLGRKKLSALRASHIPMGALELLMRMQELSPARAEPLFNEVLSGALSYRSLKTEYDRLVREAGKRATPRQLAPRRAARFEENITQFIQKYPGPYLPHPKARFVRTSENQLPGFPIELADLTAVILDENNEPIGSIGFDIRLISSDKGSASASVSRILEAVAFRAGFFQAYWTFIQEDGGNSVAAMLAQRLQLADRNEIGVVSVRPDAADDRPTHDRVVILRSPTFENSIGKLSNLQRRVMESLNRATLSQT